MDKLALLVGIDGYPYLGDLRCARNDARAFARAIQNFWGFAPNEVVTMTDDSPGVLNATRDYIFDQLENARNSGDLKYFIFGYWGHGCKLNDARYLCLPTTKESRLATSALSFAELFNDITRIGARDTLVVTDVCQTTLNRGVSDMMTVEEENAFAQFATATARNVKAKRRDNNYACNVDPTVAILNACSSGQMSYEIPNGEHGFFTESLLAVMEELASKGNGSVGDLANLVNGRVNALALRYGKQQNSYSKFEGAGPFSFPVTFRKPTDFPPIGDSPTTPTNSIEDWLREAEDALNAKVDATSRNPLKQTREILRRAKSALDSARALLESDDVRNEMLLVQLDTRLQSAKDRLEKVERGWSAFKEKKPDEALRLAESVLAEEPDHAAALELKNFTWTSGKLAEGESLFAQGKLDEALAVANAILEREPGNQSAFNLKKRVKEKKQASDRKRQEDEKKKREEEERRKRALNWLGSTPGEQRSIQIKGVECKFSFIPKGSFMMGSPSSEVRRYGDETQHRVNLSQDFWLGCYPVTQELYEAVTGANPSEFKGARRPVENVSWEDSITFTRKLNSMGVAPSGWRFDLPTEAQWEYSCRAGTSTPYNFGSQLNGYKANCDGNYPYGTEEGVFLERTTDVGSYPCNAWNLYDMHGNVWEWLLDWYGDYPENSVTDPTGPATGSYRVLRGGCWNNRALNCRSANRHGSDPSSRNDFYGFRLALVRTEEPDHAAALELKNFTWTSGKLAEGESLFAQGKLDEALAVANAILEREPGNQSAFNLKNRVKEKQASDRKRQEDEKKKREEEERRKRALNWLGSAPGEQRSIQIKGVECKFSFIPKGSFMMGSPSSESKRSNDETQHRVNLSQDFWLGSYPVTQELYKAVTGEDPSAFKGAQRPVESVNWNESIAFVNELNSIGVAPSGWRFNLPTEAQWEYSCRAGTSTPYNFGSQLNGDKANCHGKYPYGMEKGVYLKRTTDVGSYPCNAWNLYDMHGNVWEWLLDWYGAYPKNSVTDPTGSATGSDRVLRGGSWYNSAKHCRSALRNYDGPSNRYNDYGFRLALVCK